MTAPTPIARKRSGDDLMATEPKKVLRPGTAPETTTIINSQVLASDPVTEQSNESTRSIEPTTTKSSSNQILDKDETIEQLRLELASAHNELTRTRKKLLDTKHKLSEALRKTPKPPDAMDIYRTGVKEIDTTHNTLLEKVESRSRNSDSITTDTFAEDAARHLDMVEALSKMQGGLIPALDLMVRLAKTCWYDPDTTKSMSGYGESEEPFFQLDTQLFVLIDRGYTEMNEQNAADAADWAAATMKYLKRTRDYLTQFGIDGYFPESIAKLEMIT